MLFNNKKVENIPAENFDKFLESLFLEDDKKIKFYYRKVKNYIEDLYYDTKYFFKNLKYYFKFLKEDRDWDHTFIFLSLRYKLIKQRNAFIRYSKYCKHDRDIKNMNICIECLNRLIDEDYHSYPHFKELEKIKFQYAFEYENNIKKYYLNTLFSIMNKNILKWWD